MDIDHIMYINEFIYLYNNAFYFLGINEQDIRGIYKYDISTEILELIFYPDDGNINSFVMLVA